MAFRESLMDGVKGMTGLFFALLGVAGMGLRRRGPGGFSRGKVKGHKGGISFELQAELEQKRRLAVLVSRHSQIR